MLIPLHRLQWKSLKNVLDISITALYIESIYLWQSNSAVSRIEHCVIPCCTVLWGKLKEAWSQWKCGAHCVDDGGVRERGRDPKPSFSSLHRHRAELIYFSLSDTSQWQKPMLPATKRSGPQPYTSAPLLSYANEGDSSGYNGEPCVYTHRCA